MAGLPREIALLSFAEIIFNARLLESCYDPEPLPYISLDEALKISDSQPGIDLPGDYYRSIDDEFGSTSS